MTQWFAQKAIVYSHFKRKDNEVFNEVRKQRGATLCLLENGENMGFAKGNNVAVRFALNEYPVDFQHYLLLNNDTIVTEKSIELLIQAAEAHPEFSVWTPVIAYEGTRDRVWNAGGFLGRWGGRKYIAHKKPLADLPSTGVQQINFITGCALLAEKRIWESGYFLNEDFFFGEEDYFFSKQMQQQGIKMAVSFDSLIYHKTSTSIKKVSPQTHLPLFYIHYLNRMIDMRNWMSPVVYVIWKPGFIVHAVFNVWWKHWFSLSRLWKFAKNLWYQSRKNSVTREDLFGAKQLF
jgi:GT2 family glycosyltransferase